MQVQPYLSFEGRCEEAIEFYKKALGAKDEAHAKRLFGALSEGGLMDALARSLEQ